MKRIACLVVLIVLAGFSAASQGLHFRGSDYPIEDRTSMTVHLRKEFSDSLVLRFDLELSREKDYGYIFRLGRLFDKDNSGGICLFIDSMGEECQFRIIWEGRRFVSSLNYPKDEIKEGEWLPVYFKVAPRKDSVYFSVGSHFASSALELLDRTQMSLCFGKNDYRIDVPSFDLRNLSLSLDGDRIEFPLEEDSGTIASSTRPWAKATVSNPEWLNHKRRHWEKAYSCRHPLFLTCGYDPARHEVYIISSDSLTRYPVGRGSFSRVKMHEENPIHTFLGSSFPADGGYYCYEPYYGEDVDPDEPTLAFLDSAGNWTKLSCSRFPTQLHHHNLITDTLRNCHYLYGGFGNRLYNGRFYLLNSTHQWRIGPELSGDAVWPRYFASAGWDPTSDRIYLFGGMGNESGDHIVGRQYMYDLFSINPDTFEAKKLWTLSQQWPNLVPVRNMVLPGDGCFYTLMYPESKTETELQLYCFSISDGRMLKFADTIPMNSDRILTNANLYYDDAKQQLVAVIEETSNDIDSRVTVYTLSFPPLARDLSTVVKMKIRIALQLLFLVCLVGVLARFLLKKRERARGLETHPSVSILHSLDPSPNTVFLFGSFAAYDAKGDDITADFPERIRQLLFLILQGGEKGISSKSIRALLWPDKDDVHAKNLRGVSMNKLRKALGNLEGVSIVYEDGCFVMKYQEPFKCDYLMFQRILDSDHPDMDTLIRLLSRGQILLGESDPLFDKMKETVEMQVQPVMLAEMKRRMDMKEYNNAILCADILFHVDPLDEQALACKVQAYHLLGREEDARSTYQSFISRYKREYGEDYSVPFK